MNMPKVNVVKLLTKLLVVASAITLAATIYFVFTIDVLTNWRIMLPGQRESGSTGDVPAIHAGDHIVVQSLYTKLREVRGESTRYIECETRNRVFVAYPINVATADRPAGKATGTGVPLVIPRTIPDLPTTCRIRITIIYPVLPFRNVPESATSDEFKLLPERAVTQVNESEQRSALQTTPFQVQSSNQSSYLNNTTPQQSAQSNSSQEGDNVPVVPPPDDTPTPREPSLIERILGPITNLIGGNS